MEQWQTDHIMTHLVDLTKLTTFNAEMEAILLQETIISRVEVETLEKIAEREGKAAVSKALFDILVTRNNSYKVVGHAAYETAQNGTFLIFVTGLIKHMLQQHNIALEESILKTILEVECSRADSLHFFLSKVDKPQLTEKFWVPSPPPGIYIDRSICNRITVDSAVFKQNCLDTFVFSGVTRSQLCKLAGANEVALSIDVIYKRNTTSRFLFLEEAENWNRLKSLWSESQASKNKETYRSLHLIKYDKYSEEYILFKSTGCNEHISKHISAHHRDKPLFVPESQFCSDIASSSNRDPYCICDTSGMGKTWLLENLARKLHNDCSNRIVAFISLSEFTQHAALSPETSSAKIQALMKFLCPFPLLQVVMIEALKRNKIYLELLLDGFDEIAEEHFKSAICFFKEIVKSEKHVRLIMTSRPNMLKELEKTFNAVTYDIMPLSEDDQVDYLVGFWKTTGDNQEKEEKLQEFAVACLRNFKAWIKTNESDMLGILQQCYLLATVNLVSVYLYCSRSGTRSPEEFLSRTSMYDMYNRFMDLGFGKAMEVPDLIKKNELDVVSKKRTNQKSLGCDYSDKRKQLKTFHVWKALQLLHPDLAQPFLENGDTFDRQPSKEIFLCGILQASPSHRSGGIGVTFLHRTFAEFLMADLCAEICTGCYTIKENKTLLKFVEVFLNRPSAVMLRFVNAGLENMAFVSVPKEVAISSTTLSQRILYDLLWQAISGSCVQIVRLIKSILCQAFPTHSVPRKLVCRRHGQASEEKTQKEHYNSCCNHVHHAATYSDLEMVQELYRLYAACFGENLADTLGNIPCNEITPLHHAVGRRSYSLVEFFVNQISLPHRNLLVSCLTDTNWCTDEKLKAAVDICNLLLDKCSSLLQEHELSTSSGPLFAKNVHVELIKLLVLRGADTEEIREDSNFFTWRLQQMHETRSHPELCRFLILDVKAFHLFQPKPGKWKDPLIDIVKKIGDSSLAYILQVPQIDIHVVDDEGSNLVHYSIRNDNELNLVQLLIDRGVNHRQRNIHGRGALHVAAESNHIKFLEYFLSKGDSLENQDNEGNTPLHCVNRSTKVVKYLISQNANVTAVNNHGDSIAHLAAKEYLKWDDEVVGYLLTLQNAHSLFEIRNAQGQTPIDILLVHKDNLKKNFRMQPPIPGFNTANNALFFFQFGRKYLDKAVWKQLIEKADSVSGRPIRDVILHMAVKEHDLETVQQLVCEGASLECLDEEGNTPLLVSAGNMEVAKYLVLQNADPFVIDMYGNNIAHKFGGVYDFAIGSLARNHYQSLLKARNKEGRTPLHQWITEGMSLDPCTIEKVTGISGENVNATDTLGQTLFLSEVAHRGREEVLHCLHRLGADPKKTDHNGQNVLHLTAKRGGILLYKYLVSLGVSPNVLDNNGDSPLHIVAKYGLHCVKNCMSESSELLLINQAGQNIAHVGTFVSHVESKSAIFDLLELPGGPELFTMVDNKGQSPLQCWIEDRNRNWYLNVTILNEIFEKSALILDQVDHDGNTVFLSAVKVQSFWILQYLQSRGADPNVVNKRGDNALHTAARSLCDDDDTNLYKEQYDVLFKFLISVGCSVNHKNNEGHTPLLLLISLLECNLLPQHKFGKVANILNRMM